MEKYVTTIKSRYKYLIYLASTIGICWIGVCRDIGDGAQWALANNCLGFCMLPMILCRFKCRDFLKTPYYLWAILYSFISIPLYKSLAPGTDYNAQMLSGIIIAGLYGLIAIRLFYYVFIDKLVNEKSLGIAFWIWLVMMIWCCISRNVAIWPFWYLVMFGAYYIAPVTKDEMKEMISAISDGIIVSFFWIQCRAFLYRPYDQYIRYYGHFTNPNVNAMFYQLSLSGLLTRLWLLAGKREKHIFDKILIVILFLLSVSILVFVNFTGSSGAFLAVALMIGLYLIVDMIHNKKKRIKLLLVKGILVLLTFVALIYPTYLCMRYIPALRHHPIWYRDYSEQKVHSWDPIDSYKYTTFEDALSGCALSRAFNKIAILLNEEVSDVPQDICANVNEWIVTSYKIGLFNPIMMTPIRTIDYPGGTWVLEYDDGIEPGTDELHNALINYDENNTSDIRSFIWKYFFERLNMLGHEELNVGAYIFVYRGHTHNTFLQMAYLFGIPVGLGLLLLTIYGIISSFINVFRVDVSDTGMYIFPLVFLTGYLVYGMVECLSFTGEFLFTVMFLSVDMLINCNSGKKSGFHKIIK